ncbi:MAG: hypothetical protein AB7S75_19460 [Desulfococcaceae bacterium]
MNRLKIFLIAMTVFAVFFSEFPQARAEKQTSVTAETVGSQPAPEQQISGPAADSTLETLRTLIFSREAIKEKLKTKIQERRTSGTQEETAVLTNEINELNTKLRGIEHDLASVAAGISPDIFSEKSDGKFDWRDEVQNLLTPLIHQLKKMTERPRKIEFLRGEIDRHESQLATVKKAIENLELMSKKTDADDAQVQKELKQIQSFWTAKEKQIRDDLQVSRFQLTELLKEKESILGTTQNILRSFFKSRGRNFVLAFAAFFASFFLMRWLYRLVYKYSPVHQAKDRTTLMRLSDVISHILTFGISGAALITVLYMSGDWLLLSFALILLVGIAWTAREGIPRFWKQIQLMLNLGTVRENERIVYNGVPWRVVTLGVYATLENHCLRPSELRVPLGEMIGMNSRQFHKDEPWFPCRVGEWVILSDGTCGETISQTAEMVVLGLMGGARRTYLTSDFLGKSPMNISANFRITVVFGFDYAHQDIITTEIPEKLTDALRKGLALKGFEHDIIQLKTEVEAAGASSLDLLIIADFRGRAAAMYSALRRMIQHCAIEACTANGWNIPFPQITVHMPDHPSGLVQHE